MAGSSTVRDYQSNSSYLIGDLVSMSQDDHGGKTLSSWALVEVQKSRGAAAASQAAPGDGIKVQDGNWMRVVGIGIWVYDHVVMCDV